MITARSLTELGPATTTAVVTIGNFDGVHCGHQKVIASVRARAAELNARSVVVTFDPHPAHVLQPDNCPRLITPLPRKLELLAATGVDLTLVLPFTEDLRTLTARQFCQKVLCDGLRTTEIHEGETFRFGHRAEADVSGLARLGEEMCFRVVTYEPVIRRGAPVSSSRIRALIGAGDVRTARALLGRPFAIDSTPAPGRGYGTRYAVPTINLAPYSELLPANGVYISAVAYRRRARGHHLSRGHQRWQPAHLRHRLLRGRDPPLQLPAGRPHPRDPAAPHLPAAPPR